MKRTCRFAMLAATMLLVAACATPPKGFGIRVEPIAETHDLEPGGRAEIELVVESSDPSPERTTISLMGLPAGVSAEIEPNPVDERAVIAFTADRDATAGTHRVEIRGSRGGVDATTSIALAIAEHGAVDPSGERPPLPEVVVDPAVTPPVAALPGIDGGPERPLARLVDDDGRSTDFVANEAVVVAEDENAVRAFVDRWHGEILFTIDPSRLGVDAAPVHLVRVDPSSVDPASLAEDWQMLEPSVTGEFRLSSSGAVKLLALVASESLSTGLEVNVNVLFESATVRERRTAEGSSGFASMPDGSGLSENDAFTWPYMRRGGAQDIGVAEAWRILEATGRFANRSKVVVADGGFRPNDDFPPIHRVVRAGSLREPNPDPTACGGDTFTATCTWHGTHVTVTGFGLPDNAFGAAGPGGPVTDLIVMQSPSVDALNIIRYIFAEIPTAAAQRPRILNISAATDLSNGACVLACGALDALTGALRAAGILVFAAAGNDGAYVDATECVLGVKTGGVACILDWKVEVSATIPCELDEVVCVGALDWDSNYHAAFSNWGSDRDDTVDIFAPGVVWSVDDAVLADEDAGTPSDRAGIVTGTSFASPFAAGVAALVWAADPSLNADGVARILMDTAHTDSTSRVVPRWVNALAAVRRALGEDTPPFVRIDQPLEGATYSAGSARVPLEASVEDLEDGFFRPGGSLSVRWTREGSSGAIGTTPTTATLDLEPGTHRLTVTVTDSAGNAASDSVMVSIENDAPTVTITSPDDDAIVFHSQPIRLSAISYDPNDRDRLAEENVGWYLDGASTPIARTHDHTIRAGMLSVGTHTLVFRGSDGSLSASDTVSFRVEADPAGNLPPVAFIESPPSPINGASLLADRFDDARGLYYAQVCLAGRGEDPDEADPIYGSALTWYSKQAGESVFGILGSGTPAGTCLRARLYLDASGHTTEHTIRLVVRDAAGDYNSNEEEITVDVYGFF